MPRSGAAEAKGKRPTMEDAHRHLDSGDLCYYGVYDGHRGSRAALFCRDDDGGLHSAVLLAARTVLHLPLTTEDGAEESEEPEEEEEEEHSDTAMQEALQKAFAAFDTRLLQEASAGQWDDGATAAVRAYIVCFFSV